MKSYKKYLLIVLLVALSLRIGYVLTLEDRLFFPDSERYHRIALDILQGKGYDSSFTSPLYPLFLAGLYKVFGTSFLAVRIIQAIIGTISILIMYLLGKEIFSREVGLIASSIAAIYPFFIFFTGLLLTETLFILLFLCLIYLLWKLVSKKKIIYAVSLGILAGVSCLIKPIMAHFLIFTFLILFFVDKRKKWIIESFLLVSLMIGLVLSPWIIRNYQRFGAFIPFNTAGGLALYDSNNPLATGAPGSRNIEYTPEMKEMSEVELDRFFKKEAIRFILTHPKRFLELAVIKFRRFWSFTPNAGDYSSFFYKIISLLSYGPVLFLAIFGLIVSKRMWLRILPLYLPLVFFLLVHLIIIGSLRYRIPITPYLILFAGYGIHVIRTRFLPQPHLPERRESLDTSP